MNIETGEDTFAPSYVGEKAEIRKLTDVMEVYGLQVVNGNIVLQYEDESWTEHYTLIRDDTGEILVEADAIE